MTLNGKRWIRPEIARGLEFGKRLSPETKTKNLDSVHLRYRGANAQIRTGDHSLVSSFPSQVQTTFIL